MILFQVLFVYKLLRFEINLANNRGDIVLHVNPRVRDRVLVLNSAPAGNWGGEERKSLNFTTGDEFKLIIMVTEQAFKVRSIFFCFSRSRQLLISDCHQQRTCW